MRQAVLAALVALCPALGTARAEAESPCGNVAFDGASFTVCRVDVASQRIELFLDDEGGERFGDFRAVERALAGRGERLLVAMNAGMFHPDRSPVGLYVEDGIERARLITTDGPGNFGLLPNGVFCLLDEGAAVIESRAFARDRPDCRAATQSGPMLVIGGALHPRFLPQSDSLNIRNGVGVTADGRTVWLAISNERVNFHTFARLFRDGLGTPDALYLDGRVSRLWAPEAGRRDFGTSMGPILGVVAEE